MSARAIEYGSHREYDKEDFFTKQSTSQSERSIFDPDVITEADIERIWDKMKKLSARNRKYHRKRDANIISTDTTPTTGKTKITTRKSLDQHSRNYYIQSVLRG